MHPFARPRCRLLCLVLVIWTVGRGGYGVPKAESTHAERFAPQEEKLHTAEQTAEARIKEHPSDVKALLDLGMARLRVGKLDAAIADFRRAATQAPALAEAQTELAFALWVRGRLDEALRAARAALLLDPHNPDAHRYAGRLLLLQAGDRKEAIAHLEEAARLNPAEPDVHFDLLMAYRAAGDSANSWGQLRLLQTEFSENEPRLLYVQGLLVSDQGRSASAINFFRRAWSGDPNLGEARDALGVELAQAAQWPEALEVLATATKANPQSFRLAYAYALALMNTQHLAEAEQAARQALSLNPGSREARVLLGEVQTRRMAEEGKRP